MTTQKRNKIPAVYLNDETHAALKKWAEYQGTTMPKLAQAFLEDMQPMIVELIETYENVMAGDDINSAINKLLAKGLILAGEKLKEEEKSDATDSRASD